MKVFLISKYCIFLVIVVIVMTDCAFQTNTLDIPLANPTSSFTPFITLIPTGTFTSVLTPNSTRIPLVTIAPKFIPSQTVDLMATAEVSTLLTIVQPKLYASYASPDGKWLAKVIRYDCIDFTFQDYSSKIAYEQLKIIHLGDGTEKSLTINCRIVLALGKPVLVVYIGLQTVVIFTTPVLGRAFQKLAASIGTILYTVWI